MIEAEDPARTLERTLTEYRSFVRRFAELLDGLSRWQSHAEGPELERVSTLLKRSTSLLLQHGIRPIAVVGRPLDLRYHEVLDTRIVPGVEADTIVEIVEGGYEMSAGKEVALLRRARVIVAAPAETPVVVEGAKEDRE